MATHSADHDPLIRYRDCWTCHQALSATFAVLAPDLKGLEPAEIVRVLRRALVSAA